MNAAIYDFNIPQRHVSICPVGQSDQAAINKMKLGSLSSHRRNVQRPTVQFSTVWSMPVLAATA